MPTYRFGGIYSRGKRVEVDIPPLDVTLPTDRELEQLAIVDQDEHVGNRLLGLATKSHGRFYGLARATFMDHVVTREPAVELYDRYDGGVKRMNQWLRLMYLSKKVLQHTMDKVLAAALEATVSAIKIERIKRTVTTGTKRQTVEQRQKRMIRRIIKKFGPE